jgi:hypothetical protein
MDFQVEIIYGIGIIWSTNDSVIKIRANTRKIIWKSSFIAVMVFSPL